MSFEQVMRFAFLYTDVECRMQKLMASGCTCASILIVRDPNSKEKTGVTANIGDSRIILSKRDSVTRLSYVRQKKDINRRIIKQRTETKFCGSNHLVVWYLINV